MTLNVVIIDDEQNNISNLKSLLTIHCPLVNIVATAGNAAEGNAIIIKHKPDLVFLDIQMPEKNGFEMLQSIPNRDFEVVFVTAFDLYGIQAVKFSAIDYLLKPINPEELQSAVEKVIANNRLKKKNLQIENLLKIVEHAQSKEEHKIALATSKETRFIYTHKIIRCESSNNYTCFYFDSKEKLLVSKPIYEYEEILKEYGFIRCHQSHLINKKYIKSWVKEDGGYLLLEDGSSIPISKQKKEQLKLLL